jgi:hypothetical protein
MTLIRSDQSKTKRDSWQRTVITAVLSVAGQKFPGYFAGYLEYFTVSQYLYLFIPLFLAERWLVSTGLHAQFI